MDADEALATRRSTAVIRLAEGSTSAQIEDLSSRFARHAADGVTTVLVDLDGVNYLNSTALAMLVKLKHDGAARTVDVQLINVSHHVMDILRTTRLERFFFPSGS